MLNLPFLKAVLGEQASRVLIKTVQKIPQLEGHIIPQTVSCWIKNNNSYNGVLPGTEILVSLNKSEEGFDGLIAYQDTRYTLTKSNFVEVTAAISALLGVRDASINSNYKIDERLSKNIESLFLLHNSQESHTHEPLKVLNKSLESVCKKCTQNLFTKSEASYKINGCKCLLSLCKNESLDQTLSNTIIKSYPSYSIIVFDKRASPLLVDKIVHALKEN